ncbi:MAG: hypothetical protein ACTHOK_15140 [Nocardioidaceae bacterium]
MSLHDRLYAARATRAVQDQERWAEGLRAPVAVDEAALASVTPLIPAPRGPADPVPTVPRVSRT